MNELPGYKLLYSESLAVKHWAYVHGKYYYMHDHQTLVLAWTGIDCTCTQGGLLICLPEKEDA